MTDPAYSAPHHAGAMGSLVEKLDWLREHARERQPDARLVDWGRRHLDLTGDDLAPWVARAWWGIAAGELLRVYLYTRKQRHEALALLENPDWSDIEHAQASGGVILAASHLGPPKFGMNALLTRSGNPLILTNRRDMPDWLPDLSDLLIDPATADRAQIMLRAALHLRQGGLVYAAPDGGFSGAIIELQAFNRSWRFSPGLAALARIIRRPAFTTLALWEGNAIRLRTRPVPAPDDDLPPDAWHRAWIESHWQHAAEIIRSSPENLRFLCSMFRKEFGT
ncbi:hypothetical protein GCM10011452_30210 [Gemmobacter lanyuensis]|uniref:Lipid A biosynthesis lauroyl acyltransferase n=1 Tax=Gemmobacter lanyuensis TaxID=1054497 RepID=A0A918MNE7_9RHOB|nr:hypothetical protein [Gemmobacter lanyuensis]GGW39801.1 hypothetical protein GCM10011452_30210 [Gemmobacter lanyuensis]